MGLMAACRYRSSLAAVSRLALDDGERAPRLDVSLQPGYSVRRTIALYYYGGL